MSVSMREIAAGDGWQVRDVICRHGPRDRPFEEQHASVSVAAVMAGTFQYRTRAGAATLVPGALLLGIAGACFECGHAHGVGDHCLAFHFTPTFFEAVVADVPTARRIAFSAASVPANDSLVPLFADAEAARMANDVDAFEELALRFAVAALTLQTPAAPSAATPSARDERRISAAARRIEATPAARMALKTLAREAGMSPYHFLRTFRRIIGMTPHQYLLRTRMQRAAVQLRRGDESVTAVALEAGFEDLSTFNHRFRRIMSLTPTAYRQCRRT